MKPNKIVSVKAKKAWYLPSSILAITWFGIIYCKTREYADSINSTTVIDTVLKSHETIHVRQAETMNNSWFRFYMRYIWEWIKNLPLITINSWAPYRFMPIEMEAYNHEYNYDYANSGKVGEWREFEKLTLKEKRELAKEYYKSRKEH